MDFKNGGSSERRPPLAREGSIYSLTFYELQSTLGSSGSGVGKDFGSMHMDELLRSIWTAEESQAMASASASASGASGHGATQLQRQGSLTLPRTISAKTVDEVWRNLVRDAPEGATPAPMGVAASPEPQTRRQATLGEMTLEEFLVRAGVVRENPVAEAPVPPPPVPAPNSTIFYGNFASANNTGAGTVGFTSLGIGEPIMRSGLVPGVAGMGSGAVEAAVRAQLDSAGKANNDLPSPIAPVPYSFEGMMRGRRSGGGMEKVVERRQRRMIKNRESAARSRARKQAYTMELEAEVQKLKEQNRELQRKQAEIMQLQKNQVLETIKDPSGRKKRSLQRTLTGPWSWRRTVVDPARVQLRSNCT